MNFLFTFLIISARRTREVDEKLIIFQYSYKKNYTSLLPRKIINFASGWEWEKTNNMFASWSSTSHLWNGSKNILSEYFSLFFFFFFISFLFGFNECMKMCEFVWFFFMWFSKFCCWGKSVLSHTRSKQKWNKMNILIGTSELNKLNLN